MAPRDGQEALFAASADTATSDGGRLRARVCAIVRVHFARCAATDGRGRPAWNGAWVQHCAVVRALLKAGHDDPAVAEALWHARRLSVADVELRLGVLPKLEWGPDVRASRRPAGVGSIPASASGTGGNRE